MKARRMLTAGLLAFVLLPAGFILPAKAGEPATGWPTFLVEAEGVDNICRYLQGPDGSAPASKESLDCELWQFLQAMPQTLGQDLLLQIVRLARDVGAVPGLVLAFSLDQTEPMAGGSVEAWRDLVAEYFAAADVDHALAVIACESGGDPSQLNDHGSGASGLFQHMPEYWAERSALAGFAGASIFDPRANVAVAAWLVYHEGWHHWPTCG